MRKYLTQMVEFMNVTVDPCEDFYEYSCGRADNKTKVFPPEYNLRDKLKVFEKNQNGFASEGGIKAKNFYASCLKEPKLEQIFDQVAFLKPFKNNWPILDNNWKGEAFDWPKFNAELGSMDIHTIVQVDLGHIVVHGLKSHFIPTIRVRPSYTEESYEKMKRVMLEFGASDENADRIVNETHNFLKKIEDIYLNSTFVTVFETDLADLQEWIPGYPWSRHFEILSKNLNLNSSILMDSEHISKTNPHELIDMIKVINQTDSRILANYFIWKFLENFEEIDCKEVLFYFKSAINSEYWPKFKQNGNIQKFEKVIERIIKKLNSKESSLLVKLLEFYSNQVNNENSIDTNFAENLETYGDEKLAIEKINEEYGDLKINSDNYFENLVHLKYLMTKNSFLYERPHIRGNKQMEFFLEEFIDFVIVYNKEPMFHYFNTDAAIMWHPFLFSWEDFHNARICLAKQGQEYHTDDKPHLDINVYYSYKSLKEVFADYLNWLDDIRDNDKWHRAESDVFDGSQYFDNKKVFFINFAQLFCNKQDFGRKRSTRVLMNSKAFSEAFNCPIESKMNPRFKCLQD